jgi:RNA polymerase sigma factor (sigma-70 family)
MTFISNPFAETGQDVEDQELVQHACSGSRDSLERLITRHQAWIYNIALRMLYRPEDAEDVTQEILIKVIAKLSTFEARSSFRTWLYRIVVNHILNLKRREREDRVTFEWYASALERTPELDLADPHSVPADRQLLV